MNLDQPRVRASRGGVVLAFLVLNFVWGGILGGIHLDGRATVLDPLENLTADWRFLLTGPRPPPADIVIAAIDDQAVREAGGYPLPRGLLARIIRQLNEHHPAAIAVDLLFLDPGDPAADRSLADTLRVSPSVIGAAATFSPGAERVIRGAIPEPDDIHWPTGEIGNASRVGLVNIATDRSGIPRYVPLIFRAGDEIHPSLTLQAATLAMGKQAVPQHGSLVIGERLIGLDRGYHLPVRFYGRQGAVPSFSVASMIRGEPAADLVRGKVVVLGVTALGLGDMYATPFDRAVPGAEILATAIANLLSGGGLIRTTAVRWLDVTVMLLLPAACVTLLGVARATVGAAAAALLIAAWLAATFLAWRANYWLGISGPLAVLIPIVGLYLTTRAVLVRRAAGRSARDVATLARFQPAGLVRSLLANPSFLDRPVSQNAAVVFLDLSGFTGLAERLGPEASRDLLAGFHTIVDEGVVVQNGVVVSFMGDGAMILFGLPVARPDDPVRALRCVATLCHELRVWRERSPGEGAMRLAPRFGVHFGPVVISRLGSSQYQHVTATGDTVNVASRLLETAKQLEANVVVSDDAWRAAGAIPCGIAGPALEQTIRGRASPLLVRRWDPEAAPATNRPE